MFLLESGGPGNKSLLRSTLSLRTHLKAKINKLMQSKRSLVMNLRRREGGGEGNGDIRTFIHKMCMKLAANPMTGPNSDRLPTVCRPRLDDTEDQTQTIVRLQVVGNSEGDGKEDNKKQLGLRLLLQKLPLSIGRSLRSKIHCPTAVVQGRGSRREEVGGGGGSGFHKMTPKKSILATHLRARPFWVFGPISAASQHPTHTIADYLVAEVWCDCMTVVMRQ